MDTNPEELGSQLFGKPPVTALQEYCAKKNLPLPVYEFINSDEGGFICKVEAVSMTSFGHGRSKREAKHDAAAQVIKKMRTTHPDITDIPQAPHQSIPTTDTIVALRDYCIQNNHPLPTIEIIQQTGPAESPEFTALCTLSTIKRYGIANNKKEARQKAALEILELIRMEDKPEREMEIAEVETKLNEVEAERYQKFKTYYEYTESKSDEIPGILLCDRHNYFTNFFEDLKKNAWDIINTEYESVKSQALDLLRELKITPKTSCMSAVNTNEKYLLVELNCAYDVVFAGPESSLYTEIVEYFKDML